MRRRRNGKTDYRARRTLIVQDKNKYGTPKYRVVVRVTNRDVICQVVSAKVTGDKVICAAYAHELGRYGLGAGFTNYAACYATGLLLARRLLGKVGLDKYYEGCTDVNGEYFENEVNEEMDEDGVRNPFRAYLDVGLARTTTGSRIFGCLKGAVDGGLDIPHREKRFPGWFPADPAAAAGGKKGKKSKQQFEEAEDEFDAEIHRKYIFGGHVADYMRKMEEEAPEKYASHFSRYIKAGIGADDVEGMYEKVHEAIRADPSPAAKAAKNKKALGALSKKFKKGVKYSHGLRRARAQAKIRYAIAQGKTAGLPLVTELRPIDNTRMVV